MYERDYLDIDRHWGILAYYDALPSDFAQLAPILREFGCPESEIGRAYSTIHRTNKAFVFTAPWARMSVMVVGRVTHPSQFLNSLLHEFDHLQDAILQYYQAIVNGSVVVGEWIRKLYDVIVDGMEKFLRQWEG